ncbi:hypothetical protein [Paraburkholderia unamae]|uniref:Uncharacterized protein n=1 Tax=Paraburkholderia unamae TaxID=219649 RepID=A0ACC6RGR0_9BURK
MSISLEDFLAKTNAEVVGGRIIVGMQADRMIVGETTPVFALNEDGHALLQEVLAGVAPVAATQDVATKKQKRVSGAKEDAPVPSNAAPVAATPVATPVA